MFLRLTFLTSVLNHAEVFDRGSPDKVDSKLFGAVLGFILFIGGG